MKPVWQRVARLNFDGTCYVENSKGQKYLVHIPEYLSDVRTGDTALVQKSPVSKEWNMIDYQIRTSYFEDVEPECPGQTTLDDEPDYLFNTEEAEWI